MIHLSLLLATFLAVDEAPEPPASLSLEPMVVVATRSPRPVSEVAAIVDLIDARTLAAEHVTGMGNLGRYHPGIDAEIDGTRFGATGLNIRGMGGNRVAIEVDGVPISDQFDVGSYANAGRNLIDPELISRVEILRGPASTLYGSDAIGGVAAFFTWQPSELTGIHSTGSRIRSGYDSASDGRFASLVTAWNGDQVGVIAGLVDRRVNAQDHAAASSADDSLTGHTQSALIGLSAAITDQQSIAFSALGLTAERQSTLESPLGRGRFRSTSALEGDDEQVRTQAALRWNSADPWPGFDNFSVEIQRQESRTDQRTFEARAARDQRFERRFRYEQDTLGAEVAARARFDAWGADHQLAIGAAWSRVETRERRDGLQTRLDGSAATNLILGEQFPVRDFPTTETSTGALWIQDEISWDRLTLIPGLRYDSERLRPQPDALYLADNPNTEVVSVNAADTSPKLGALLDLNDHWRLFGQYAAGFRAPPFEDVNVGLDLPLFNIRAIPNPDLESETSDSFELGLRWSKPGRSLEVALFRNEYDNFIETRVPVGFDPASGALLFQSRNVDRATISGLEARLSWDLQGRFDAFTVRSELLALTGEDAVSGAPLASVGPSELLLGVRWEPSQTLGLEFIARGVDAAERPENSPDAFVAPGHAVIDLLGAWQPHPLAQIQLALLNLTDRTYWSHQAVRGLQRDDPLAGLMSAPGRGFSASLEIRF